MYLARRILYLPASEKGIFVVSSGDGWPSRRPVSRGFGN